MGKLLERKDIKKEDTWAIETVYKDDKAYEEDFIKLTKELPVLAEKVKKFLDSKEDFKELFLYSEKVDLLLNRLALYASMKSDEDTRNSTYQQMSGKLELLYSKINEINSEIVPRILKFDEKKLKEYINQNELKEHKFFFKTILDFKKHSLTEEQ